MALYAILFLLGALTVVLVVLVGIYVASNRVSVGVDPDRPGPRATVHSGSSSERRWSSHVGSLDEPVRPTNQEEIPIWQQHVEAARVADPGVYKSRRTSPYTGDHWDPYAESQSRASRAKAARRKPRPHRSMHVAEHLEFYPGETDAYTLLGVSRVASAEEIERAYRRRVASIHPDKFHGDPIGQRDAAQRLKQLNLAMKVVRDRVSRADNGSGETPS